MRQNEVRPRKRRRPPTRRKTVRWSSGEVDALLSGVRVHGVGRWATILRHSKVFKGVRTSVDLKDKWRNLTSPVRAAALAARDATVGDQPREQHVNAIGEDGDADMGGKEEAVVVNDDMDVASRKVDARAGSRESSPVLSLHSGSMASPKIHSPGRSQSDLQSSSPSADPCHPVDSSPPLHASSSPQSPVHSPNQSQCLTHTDAHTPSLAPPPVNSTQPASAAPTPPTPSESSVSPEVLSTPFPHFPAASTAASPAIGYPFSYASPYLAGVPPVPFPSPVTPQVAAMQQAVNPGLYQRAAAMTAYCRGMGQEPNPYSIAMALTASAASPQINRMAMGASSGFPDMAGVADDDDDDDDDDEDEDDVNGSGHAGPGSFPFGAHGLYGKNSVQIPGLHPAFVQAYSTAVAMSSMIQNGAAQASVSPPNINSYTNSQPMMAEERKTEKRAQVVQGGDGPRVSTFTAGGESATGVPNSDVVIGDVGGEEKVSKDVSGDAKMEDDVGIASSRTRSEADHPPGERYEQTTGGIDEASGVGYSTSGFGVHDEKGDGHEEDMDEKKGENALGAVSTLFEVHNGDHHTFSVTDF
eukprot:GFKZ01006571.1.p1 GENE.GFKZ01006571.1~~GFKZ01006571.1.p1  ORF type:complete len:584 (+),score=99.27 GFKZ01006571.1:614-2365(+)